jgi:hypothetical protein
MKIECPAPPIRRPRHAARQRPSGDRLQQARHGRRSSPSSRARARTFPKLGAVASMVLSARSGSPTYLD